MEQERDKQSRRMEKQAVVERERKEMRHGESKETHRLLLLAYNGSPFSNWLCSPHN